MRRSIESSLLGAPPDPVRLGRFVVLGLAGTGGMGRVYKAFDPKLERLVAVKIVGARTDRERHRLEEEARALAKLSHPNVVAVYEVGETGSDVFIAMEYVAGGTLRDWYEAHPGRTAELVDYFEQAASGLIAAHTAGIVHRDLKPGNMLIDDGRLRLADFGLAVANDEKLAGDGAGTPAYMAPEQRLGAADAKSDQYSLCATFKEAFRGGAPRGVAQVLQRGMSDEPAARFESVSALRAALLTGRRRRRLVLATVGVAAAIGTTALAVRPQAVIPCKARTDLIDAGWGAERRAAVEATLVQSGLGYAPATWDRIGWQLDEAATQWADDDLAACRASRNADPDQRRRAEGELLCLERAAATLGHATTVLAEGDPQVLARAVTLVDATRDRMVCDRPAPEARDVSALLSELDRAGVAEAAGRSASATAGWQAVLDATQPGELPRLRASALLGLANTAAPYGDSAELRWATEALTEAERSADPTTQAQAWIHLAGLAGRAGSAQTLAFRVARAQRLMEDGSIPPRLTAELLWRVGEAYQSAGMFAESAAVLKESRRAFEEHVPGAASRTYVISSQAQAELFVGRGDQALSLATEALAAFERSRGMAHPEAAVLLIRRAAVHGALQDNGGAAADLRAAIVLLQANPSYRPDLSITAHDQLAEALLNDGAHEEALRQSDRALALAADLYEDDDASRATYLWTRAAILYETEAYGRALRTIDDALEALGDGDPDKETSVLALLLLRAETLLRLERRDEGRLALRVATDAARAAVDRRSPAGLQHTEVIARSLLALGEVEAGRKEIALGIEDALALGDDGRVRTLQALLTDSGPSGER